MAYLIALGILSLIGIVATVWIVRTDGYGRIPTDPSRVARVDRQPRPARPVRAAVARTARTARPAVTVASEPAPARVVASPTTAPLRVVRAD